MEKEPTIVPTQITVSDTHALHTACACAWSAVWLINNNFHATSFITHSVIRQNRWAPLLPLLSPLLFLLFPLLLLSLIFYYLDSNQPEAHGQFSFPLPLPFLPNLSLLFNSTFLILNPVDALLYLLFLFFLPSCDPDILHALSSTLTHRHTFSPHLSPPHSLHLNFFHSNVNCSSFRLLSIFL